MYDPGVNANVPQIPPPLANVGALVTVAQLLKQGMDSLAGNRGSPLERAVTFRDLITLGILGSASINAPVVIAAPTQVLSTTTGAAVVNPYVLSGFVPSTMHSLQVVLGHRFPVQVMFAANFGPITPAMSSEFGAFVPATGAPVVSIERCVADADPTSPGNWAIVGSATFSGTAATLATADGGALVCARHDRIRVRAPAVPDFTLAQMFMCLVGQR